MEKGRDSNEPLITRIAKAIVKVYIFLLSMLPMPCGRDRDE